MSFTSEHKTMKINRFHVAQKITYLSEVGPADNKSLEVDNLLEFGQKKGVCWQ